MKILLVLFYFLLQYASGANILYVAPIASPSLQRWNRALAMGLRDKGHNVTMLSHDSEKGSTPKNFTLILLEATLALHPNIRFTLELEQNESINYLDFKLLNFNYAENKFEYTIYRKPTQADITIPQDSCHHTTHKVSAYKSLVHRAFTIRLDKGIYEKLENKIQTNDIREEITAVKTVKALFNHVQFCCQHDFNTTGFKTLMRYPKKYKFDLIIFDASYGRCFYPLIHRFNNPPAVAVTPYRLPPILSNSFGNHLHTSYTPYYNTEYSTKMSFVERLLNFFYTYVEVMYRRHSFSPRENKMAKEQFGEETPALRDFERNMSLLLPNVDFIMDFPMALPPNIVPVGGLHLTPGKTLPKDLQKIADEAKNGLIFFSLGALLRSDKLSEFQQANLVEAFKKLPQIILWKYEGDNIAGLPKNVIIRKSFPQNDILGHKNTKLFITHGGILSTQEAMYHAVPVVGIPFTSDQKANVRRMERRKVARLVSYRNLTTENILSNIKEVLENPIYSKNIKFMSKKFKDQPQTPLQRAIFWIEYVIRHGTAEHLVSPARDMDAYATGNLDILGVFLAGVLGIYLAYLFLPAGIKLAYQMLRNHIQAK